jgi:hypothetical protein
MPQEPSDLLKSWARVKGLDVTEYEHWDATVTHVTVTDSGNDIYQIYARPRDAGSLLRSSSPSGKLVVGATITKRGSSKHRAFRRERERFRFELESTVEGLNSALDQALAKVRTWISEAGNR